MTQSFFFVLPDAVERHVLALLVDYCAGLSGSSFSHVFRTSGQRLTSLLCDYEFAQGDGVGFRELLDIKARHQAFSTKPFDELPCVEDVLDCAFGMADQYGLLAPEDSWHWYTKAEFSEELMDVLKVLQLIDVNGFWTRNSVPIQLRAGFLKATGDTGCEIGNTYIEEVARLSYVDIPPDANALLGQIDLFTPRHDRGECDRFFGQNWRFGRWVTKEAQSRVADLGGDWLSRAVIEQMLINRHNI